MRKFSLATSEKREWKSGFRQTGSTQKLLFVHQTAFHRQLLKRYGNHICLLDATYRTILTKHSIPLFFVVVKTNIDCQVVAGSFAIQDETNHSVGEALAVLSSWNDAWRPKFFMTDNCDEEIQATESQFEGE